MALGARETVTLFGRFRKVLLPELNSGQLALVLRGRFLKDVISYPKIQGRPFQRREIYDRIVELMEAQR